MSVARSRRGEACLRPPPHTSNLRQRAITRIAPTRAAEGDDRDRAYGRQRAITRIAPTAAAKRPKTRAKGEHEVRPYLRLRAHDTTPIAASVPSADQTPGGSGTGV